MAASLCPIRSGKTPNDGLQNELAGKVAIATGSERNISLITAEELACVTAEELACAGGHPEQSTL